MKEYEQDHNDDSKEDIIQHLIQSGCYKSSDGRQLYELTIFELAHEYHNSLHE
ncbi:Fur-regulated basic protein FbpA [Salipaludibacillus sp. CUR1]|uniref:Fur-regulated basic protein FbpA n=1 Tax=Salipaludibacillus sp. CUR1 TaxID=2820003 RepID=UPI001E2967AE|nr:Fur-regulated basic protein FbpA [Salipaludibacillus sp. CUR1]MCE7793816.1 Fur-regulated basic protein FbpA [Salipaludibacillus sp. CUR1]